MHVCAWCNQQIGSEHEEPSERPVANYGMCSDCLIVRLSGFNSALEKPKLVRARRMRRCGQSLTHIGDVLGVSQPILHVALSAG